GQELFGALMALIGCLDQIRKRRKQRQDLFLNACDRGSNRRSIKNGATLLHGGVQGGGSEGQGSVGIEVVYSTASRKGNECFGQERFEQAPLRVPFGGFGFACAWGTIAQTHHTSPKTSIAHLSETTIALRRDKAWRIPPILI